MDGSGSSWGPHSPPQGLEEVPVPTFLMFFLQDNPDCRAACPLRPEVARDEAQRGAEAGGGWSAQASPPPTVPGTWVLGMSLQMAGKREITDGPLPVREQQDRGCSKQPEGAPHRTAQRREGTGWG